MPEKITSLRLTKGGREYQNIIDEPGGLGPATGFADVTHGATFGEPTIGYTNVMGYNDPLFIDTHLGYKLIEQVLMDDEQIDDGPMVRIQEFSDRGIVIVRVEDGGIDIEYLEYNDGELELDAIISTIRLEVDVTVAEAAPTPENPRQPQRIEGRIIAVDGKASEFSISDDGYSQWGAGVDRLGFNVGLLEGIVETIANDGLLHEPRYPDPDNQL